jgi:hypothetical protein
VAPWFGLSDPKTICFLSSLQIFSFKGAFFLCSFGKVQFFFLGDNIDGISTGPFCPFTGFA